MPLLIQQALVISTTTGLLQMWPVELAATLALNKGTPLVTVTYMITYPLVSPIGFVFQSPCHLCLFALNLPQLHILNNKYPTLLVITVIAVQGKRSINNNAYFVKLPFCVINTSYWSRKLKMKSLHLMEAIRKLHPSSLLTDSLGGACLYLIYTLKTKQSPIWVCCVLGLIIPCHSFGCHVPMHYL